MFSWQSGGSYLQKYSIQEIRLCVFFINVPSASSGSSWGLVTGSILNSSWVWLLFQVSCLWNPSGFSGLVLGFCFHLVLSDI
eukprot:g69151.t1